MITFTDYGRFICSGDPNNGGEQIPKDETCTAYVDVLALVEAGQAEIVEAPSVPDPIPQVVTRYQARVALLRAGKLEDAESAVASADAETKLKWSEIPEWHRVNPTLIALATGIGLSSGDIDDLFRSAATVTA